MSISDRYTTRIFGERLRKIREIAGLSQGELAGKLGVSRGSISFYENGERTPDIEFLDAVSVFSGVPIDYFLGYTNNIKEENADIGLRLGISDEAIAVWQDVLWDSDKELLSTLIENKKFPKLLNYMCSYTYGGTPYLLGDLSMDDEKELYEGYRSFLISKLIIEILDELRAEKKERVNREEWEKLSPEEKEYLIKRISTESKALEEKFSEQRIDMSNVHFDHECNLRLKIRTALGAYEDSQTEGDPDGNDTEKE